MRQLDISGRSLIDTVKTGMDTVRTNAVSASRGFKRPNVMNIILLLLPLLALLLWSISLQTVTLNNMNDLGLISVLPPFNIIALIILMISFCLALRLPQMRQPILLLHLVLLIFMLYGVTTLVEEAPRFADVYKYAGYVEYITRNGSFDPNIYIYPNWPGFFILSAFVTQDRRIP